MRPSLKNDLRLGETLRDPGETIDPMVAMKPSELLVMLEDLRNLIRTSWTAGSLARTLDGLSLHPLDPRAEKWCLLGGVGKVSWNSEPDQRERRFELLSVALARVEPWIPVVGAGLFNDREGNEAILRIVLRAYEIERERCERNLR